MFIAGFVITLVIVVPIGLFIWLLRATSNSTARVERVQREMAAAEQARVERLAQRNVAIREAEARLEGK